MEKDRLQSKIKELLQMNEDQESEFNIKMEKVNEEMETQIHMKVNNNFLNFFPQIKQK